MGRFKNTIAVIHYSCSGSIKIVQSKDAMQT